MIALVQKHHREEAVRIFFIGQKVPHWVGGWINTGYRSTAMQGTPEQNKRWARMTRMAQSLADAEARGGAAK